MVELGSKISVEYKQKSSQLSQIKAVFKRLILKSVNTIIWLLTEVKRTTALTFDVLEQ